jgi:hypothetical protein
MKRLFDTILYGKCNGNNTAVQIYSFAHYNWAINECGLVRIRFDIVGEATLLTSAYRQTDFYH